MTEEIHINDVGTVFEVTLKDGDVVLPDLSTATVTEIHFRKPDGSVVIKDAEFKTDGNDGIIQYVTVDGDLDQTGGWKLQAKVTLLTGTWSSSVGKFKVYPNL